MGHWIMHNVFCYQNIVPLALGKLAKLESCNSESGGSFEV
jgi:hypothetical protein